MLMDNNADDLNVLTNVSRQSALELHRGAGYQIANERTRHSLPVSSRHAAGALKPKTKHVNM
jgi:hypothetical protein